MVSQLGTFTATGTAGGTIVRSFDVTGAPLGFRNHTVTAIPSGSPTSATIKLEGSIDNTNWFDLSGDQTCTSAVMFHVVDKPVLYARVNVTALSGGSSPSLAVYYLGVQ